MLGTIRFRTSRCCRTPKNSSRDQGRSEGPIEHIQPGLNDISLVLRPLHQHPGIDDVDADEWQYQRSRRRPGDPSANLIDPTGQEQRRDRYRTSGSLSVSPSFLRALGLRAGHHRSARKPDRCSCQRCRHAHGSALHALLGHLGVQANFFITRPFWGQDYKLPCAVGRHYCCVAEVYFTANPGAVIKASSQNDVHRAQ